MKFTVKEEEELYTFLRNILPNKSKNNIKNLLKNNCILVNNKVITKYNYLLRKNDLISVNKSIKEKDFSLIIIYEDENIIVVDKPFGMLTISNKMEKENTLYRKVSEYLKKDNKKVFVIHRLDKDTSGIVMFAKNQKIQKKYQENWNSLAKVREYTAVVEGKVNIKGHIESYLKQTKTLLVYSSKNNNGDFAVTDYERMQTNNRYSIVKIHISTGRRNQIRCHMADILHPIVGDAKYHSKSNPIKRLALHANLLKISNPLTNKLLIFESKIPEEFYNIVK